MISENIPMHVFEMAWILGSAQRKRDLEQKKKDLDQRRSQLRDQLRPRLKKMIDELPARIVDSVRRGEKSILLFKLNPQEFSTTHSRCGEEPDLPLAGTRAEIIISEMQASEIQTSLSIYTKRKRFIGRVWNIDLMVNIENCASLVKND